MPKEFSRTERVAAQIQRELAELIQFEIKDPRVEMVSISAVEVTRDLAYAKVYVTRLGASREQIEETVEALNRAAGFLRRQLGKVMKIRVIPQLTFLYDDSIEKGASLSALIDAAVASDKNEQ